ncbi:MAG: flagellar basal-body rod protein FlgF [Alphaproteobacteria bacterium]|jgi:flagellar basal-body rod protein FlgF
MENVALIGLSNQVALRREMDVIANNLANLNTTGFKADNVVFEEFINPTARDATFQRGRDRRVSFVWDRATTHNLAQGEIQPTGNALDVAIGGSGMFMVRTPDGDRYTRNGSFELNAQNQLVTKQGYPVLGEGGPITLLASDTNLTISKDGTIATAQGVRGKLRLAEVASLKDLRKEGENLFSLVGGAQTTPVRFPDVRQNYLERSNVRPVVELSRMIEVNRAYQSLSSMIEKYDQLRRESIRSLGDVTR